MTTTSTRAPRRDAAENRGALLEAARVLLNRDPSVSLEAIAAEAGLSRRSVYGHFANRDELVQELVTLGSQRVAGALDGVSHPDPVVRLALIGARLWREVESVRVMAVIAVRGPLASRTAEPLSPVRRSVHAAIVEGQQQGGMRSDLAAPLLARLVEASALSVLEESTAHPLGSHEGHDLVMLMVLGVVGLAADAARAVIDDHAELAWTAAER
ncbi:MAG: putative TetR-family transcriptional regulator [Microbacteriaceae bacterium]|jgi:AcrR family transcriptional regulator|nr:putative TetR-family transcriptional regulator [Microbacteriaceae bacterium]